MADNGTGVNGSEADDASSLLELPEEHLEALGEAFMNAVRLVEASDLAGAEAAFVAILETEPRLAEPRLEIARLRMEADDLETAEAQARQALKLLASGGQWNVDVPRAVMASLAHGLLGEILRQKASSDEVLEGPREQLIAGLRAACDQFHIAVEKDPENEHAKYHAFHLGVQLSKEEVS
jgi:tetratricopeptide (TPR) repeat protein